MADAIEEIVEPTATPVEGEAGTEVIEEGEGAKPSGEEEGKTPTTDEESGDPEEGVKKDKGTPKGFQKKIDKLTGKNARLAEENAYYKGLEEGRKTSDAPEEAETTELVKPNRDDFEDYDDYSEALTDYKVDVKLAERDKVNAEAAKVTAKETAQNQAQDNFQKQIADARAKHPDFDEMVMNNRDVAITGDMLNIMQESTVGAEVAYHLAQNPEEALRIAGLSPTAQAMALGRIEGIVDAPESTITPTPRRVTQAPTPIGKGVQGKGAAPSVDLGSAEADNMSTAEWMRRRNQQVNGG